MSVVSPARPEWGPQIRRLGVTDEVISRFRDLILQGVLTPGCKLPSERELVDVLGVSRPTLRQALKALQFLGIIRSRQGDGSYLEESTSEILKAPLDFAVAMKGRGQHDLMETRLTIEVKVAALAADRRTVDDLEHLQTALDGMRRSAGVPDAWCAHDIEFHARVVDAAKNAVMASVFEMLSHLLLASRMETVRQLTDYAGSLRSHEQILEAIRRKDAVGAGEAMAEHFRLIDDRAKRTTRASSGESAS